MIYHSSASLPFIATVFNQYSNHSFFALCVRDSLILRGKSRAKKAGLDFEC